VRFEQGLSARTALENGCSNNLKESVANRDRCTQSSTKGGRAVRGMGVKYSIRILL